MSIAASLSRSRVNPPLPDAIFMGLRSLVFRFLRDIAARQARERLKQDALAMASHDLRSALSSLGLTLDLLTKGHLGTLNEAGERLVSRSNASIKQLTIMMRALLELERFESGEALAYQPTNLSDVIEDAVHVISAQIYDRRIKIIANLTDVVVDIDPQLVIRVFLNLLYNAAKYSPHGGTIWITSRKIAGAFGEEQVEVQIIDQGPGVHPDERHTIFERFKQSSQTDLGSPEGCGLGLAICKAIVEAHCGNIGVADTAHGGSCFWIEIPVMRA